MHYVITALDFFLLGWIFWPITLILMVWAYGIVSVAHKFHRGPLFLFGMVTALTLYRYETWREWLCDWHNIIYTMMAYIIAGLIVSVVKWTILVSKFNRAAKAHLAIGKPMDEMYDFKTKHDNGMWVLDWDKYSIASWWTYWPLHTLYIVFEPLYEGFEFLCRIFRNVFSAISRAGGVKTK